MVKDNKKILFVVGLIILAFALYKYSLNFSIIDDPTLSNQITSTFKGYNWVAKTNLQFDTFSLERQIDVASDCRETVTGTYVNSISSGILQTRGLSFTECYLSGGVCSGSCGYAEPTSFSASSENLNTLLYTTNLNLNIETFGFLRLAITPHQTTCTNCAGPVITDKIYLFNPDKEYELYSVTGSYINQPVIITLYKHLGYIIKDINGNTELINIENGTYQILISSSITGGNTVYYLPLDGRYHAGPWSVQNNLVIDEINVSNVSMYVTDFYINNITNKTYYSHTYINQTVNQTYNFNSTISQTIVQEPGFFAKFGLAIIIAVIAGIVIIYLWRKKK